MAYSPSSPITGTAQTGFTSPTYTITADTAPGANGKQYAVTALGGTQTGVTVHSVASPFTLTFFRPLILKGLQAVLPNGLLRNVPRNSYKYIVRKGVTPLSGQPAVPMVITMTVDVPAGADNYDAANVRACLSAAIGLLSQQSAGIGDTATTGIM